MKKHIHAFFIGRVQGVGFRFTAVDMATELGICGWAKNLPDGRVEVAAEAEEGKLEEFLQRLRHYFDRYIQDVDVERLPLTGEFKDFSIKV